MSIRSYQDVILERLRNIATPDVGRATLEVTSVMDFSNVGTLVVVRRSDLSTVIRLSFDFQGSRVSMAFDHPPRTMLAGPRSNTRFWWTVGDADADAEVSRLLACWKDELIARTDNNLWHRN